MLNKIKKMINRIEKTRDVLNEREDALNNLIRPIFNPAMKINWTPGISNVKIRNDDVVIAYSYREEAPNYCTIPKTIFEADDPVKAASDWHDEQKKQKMIKKRAQRRVELLRELAYIEEEYNEDNL